MADRVTRPSNANAHPGMVDRNPTRRSKEEIQAEKQAKAAAKAQAMMEKKANIDKVAAIEKAAKQKAKDMDREANDPVDPVTQARARKARKRPESEDEGPAKTPAKKRKTSDEIVESPPSGSEYEGEDQPDSEESQEETQSEGELEDDEPDTRIKIKKGGKKQKKGHIARDQISAAVAALSDDPSLSPFVGTKRATVTGSKFNQTPGPASKRLKSSQPPSGVVSNWQKVQHIQPPIIPGKRSGFASEIDSDTCHSRGSQLDQPSSRATSGEPVADAVSYRYGGFMPDDEGLERHDIKGIEPEKKSASMYKARHGY
ncbi:hypothetical protein BJV78DRAFT_1282635 [Lactifluus subvellereus]|nr:hypothetical protein BJV78DRAFT_1282635 [Lactifluus subvellereus]